MKRISLLLSLLLIAGAAANAQTQNVTFSVDMNNVGFGFTSVNVSGTFNAWSGTADSLVDQGGGIWSTTIPVDSGTHMFLFSADDWTNQEGFNGGEFCVITDGNFNNRLLLVDSTDVSIGTVCWDSCVACAATPPTGTKNVTFTVDVNPFVGAFTTVYVSGTFNGWNGTAGALTDQGNGIWSGILPVPVGAHEYKFTVDNWNDQENFTAGDACTVTNGGFTNRFLNISSDTVLSTRCWGSCALCGGAPVAASDTTLVTLQVDMSQYAPAFTQVYASGSFNGWSGTADSLADQGNGIWAGTVNVIADTAYEYKFTLDGWTADEQFTGTEPCAINTTGTANRALQVAGDSTLSPVCWESCDTCATIVVPPSGDTTLVTFQVNMSQYAPAFTQVYVSGSFNGWSGTADSLTDQGNGLWAGTVNLFADTAYEYKFTLDGWTADEQFTGTEPCAINTTGTTNRALQVAGDSTLSPVCWESCDTCVTIVPPPTGDTTFVTFQVDMSQYAAPFDSVYVAGTFNGYDPEVAPMSDANLDDIWMITLPVDSGSHSFKFVVDSGAVWESFVGGESCTVIFGGFYNRALEVSTDTVLPLVCWNSCDSCPATVPFDTVNVTFQVDMSLYAGAYTTVYVAGEFNGWSGNTNPLTDMGNGVWSAAYALDGDSTYQYKFEVDDWSDDELFGGGESCTVMNGPNVNRELALAAADTVLPLVCWGSCDSCPVIVPGDSVFVTFQVDMSLYGSVPGAVSVAGTFTGWAPGIIMLADPDLDGIWSGVTQLPENNTFEFKYTVDNGTVWENFGGGESCTVNNGTSWNRELVLGASNTILQPVCWESCTVCNPIDPVAASAQVTNDDCLDGTGAIVLNVTGGVTPYNYQWSNGSALAGLNSLDPGTYSVTVTDNNGSSTTVLGLDVDGPAAALALSTTTTEPTVAANDGTASLTVTGGTSPYSYAWSNGATMANITDLTPGAYTVTVMDDLGCTATAVANVSPVGVGEAPFAASVVLFPNPAREEITLQARFTQLELVGVVITDLSGRTLVQRQQMASQLTMPIDVSEFAAGVYLIGIKTSSGVVQRRFSVLD